MISAEDDQGPSPLSPLAEKRSPTSAERAACSGTHRLVRATPSSAEPGIPDAAAVAATADDGNDDAVADPLPGLSFNVGRQPERVDPSEQLR
jgi:hypothetical protein